MKNIKFIGTVKIVERNGNLYWDFEKVEDFKNIVTMACRKYGITSRKKRIQKKYFNKLMNDALLSAIKDMENESKT